MPGRQASVNLQVVAIWKSAGRDARMVVKAIWWART